MTMDYGKFQHSRAAICQCSECSGFFLLKVDSGFFPRDSFPFFLFSYNLYLANKTTSQALLPTQADKLLEQK